MVGGCSTAPLIFLAKSHHWLLLRALPLCPDHISVPWALFPLSSSERWCWVLPFAEFTSPVHLQHSLVLQALFTWPQSHTLSIYNTALMQRSRAPPSGPVSMPCTVFCTDDRGRLILLVPFTPLVIYTHTDDAGLLFFAMILFPVQSHHHIDGMSMCLTSRTPLPSGN